jgi:hypothetical protein
MKYYIKIWLKKALIKIAEEGQTKAVSTDHETGTKETTKGPSTYI